AASTADQVQSARLEQGGARAPVSPVCNARRSAQLLRRQVAYVAALVRQRSHRREKQPLGSPHRAACEDRLEQLDVDVTVPPRTGVSEQQSEGAGSATAGDTLIHRDQAA